MSVEDITTVDAAQESADFDAGFEGKEAEPVAKKPEPAEAPREEVEAPKYRQVTEKDWEEVVAAAKKTASYDSQLSKAFGTIGNLQKIVNGLQSQPQPGRKIEISKDAFAAMEKDFPELAQQTRAALEAALSGVHAPGAIDVDAGKIQAMLTEYTVKRETEILEEDHPDWREIVGQVAGPNDKPDPENAFRKWLATKDAAYQTRINNTMSPPVIARAIRLFQNESKATPKPPVTPRPDARADRIRSAVQPRGDHAGAAPSEEDAFTAGFNSR